MPSPAQAALSTATNLGTSTAETTIVAADANFRNHLSGLVITTLNNAASVITIKEATGGATRATFDYPNAAAVPGAPLVVNFDPPLLGLSNANWTATSSVNATGTKITASFVKGQ